MFSFSRAAFLLPLSIITPLSKLGVSIVGNPGSAQAVRDGKKASKISKGDKKKRLKIASEVLLLWTGSTVITRYNQECRYTVKSSTEAKVVANQVSFEQLMKTLQIHPIQA